MIDRERAIRILENERECCNRTCARIECGECDLVMDTDWLKQGLDDAIALLKDQPEVIRCKDCKWWDKKAGSNYGYCHACKHGYYTDHWEIGIYRTYNGDFFCADGERKEGR